MKATITRSGYAALLFLAGAALIQQACSGSVVDTFESPPRGWTACLEDGDSDRLGVAPHSIEISIRIHSGTEDPARRFPCAEIELDYGEGSGWQDVTPATHSVGTGPPLQVGQVTHTYMEPGKYILRARVTWWDGRVEIRPTPQNIQYLLDTGRDPYITVLPPEGSGGEPSGGGEPEDDEWEIVSFTDPRDGTTYDIIDGRALIAFRLPLDQAAAEQFLADMELSAYSEWWEVGSVGVLLPAGVSVLEAVTDWPAQHPELIESVDPDAVGEAVE